MSIADIPGVLGEERDASIGDLIRRTTRPVNQLSTHQIRQRPTTTPLGPIPACRNLLTQLLGGELHVCEDIRHQFTT
ncbi:hypothetical protein GOACH_15_00660 [Gordonia aichiensis NBRC 108223]|uniref:Uncharacterized protein n=1 Tax=Gordonia aichiensis NBRC 108223 TaxID=1220583 RepID=L7KLT9_9ACTN|nr:hypothetical protein GOACH_15_00660 [Gordonia aichiensis NBRC 108223]